MSDVSPRQRVLIVDDEPTNIKILGSILKNDYKVLIATNGEEALERARSVPPPDLILMDIVMPGINGNEACERLKADETTRGIPVILMSGGYEDEDEARGMRLGAVDFLSKPFSVVGVKTRVDNHLELKRYRDLFEKITTAGASESAEAANRIKGELLDKMSKEINDIIDTTRRLLETDLSKKQLQYGEILRSSSDALLSIANEFAGFAKM